MVTSEYKKTQLSLVIPYRIGEMYRVYLPPKWPTTKLDSLTHSKLGSGQNDRVSVKVRLCTVLVVIVVINTVCDLCVEDMHLSGWLCGIFYCCMLVRLSSALIVAPI